MITRYGDKTRMARTARTAIARTALAVVLVAGLPGAAAAQQDGGRLAAISDIHFDPFATEGLPQRLLAAAPGSAGSIGGPQAAAGAFARYGRDTNLPLLEAALDAFAGHAAGADLVIFPGDALSHDFNPDAAEALGVPLDDARIGELAANTTTFIIDRVRAAAGDLPVAFVLGNDDAACGDYMITPSGRYLERVAASVRAAAGAANLDETFDATWRRGGYYEMRHPARADIRILALNTILWSVNYQNRCGDGSLAAGHEHLDWLAARLADAERQGDKVWIVGHIPVGIDAFASSRHRDRTCRDGPVRLLREEFETALVPLLARHADGIAAIFNGHIHRDGYRLIGPAGGRPDTSAPPPAADAGGGGGETATHSGTQENAGRRSGAGTTMIAAKIVPAISPIYDNNPAFQLFTYGADGRIADFETYSLDLATHPDGATARWPREYGFRDTYGEAFSDAAVAAIVADVLAAPTAPEAGTFARHYTSGYRPPTGEALEAVACVIGDTGAAAFTACFCGDTSAATSGTVGRPEPAPSATSPSGSEASR